MAAPDQNEFWKNLPFRLGTTSYIIPEGLAENAAYLSNRAADMELVLFHQGPDMSNIPTLDEVTRLKRIADESSLSFTIHLPLDLDCNPSPQQEHHSTTLAKKVIELTLPLEPLAYVAHLDGRAFLENPSIAILDRIIEGALITIEDLRTVLGNRLDLISLENLEGYPPDFTFSVFQKLPIQQCIDIGHLWLDDHDPLPYLKDHLARTTVIHLHGIENGKDHNSLVHQPLSDTKPVWEFLLKNFTGVVSLELFGEEAFHPSMELLERISGKVE